MNTLQQPAADAAVDSDLSALDTAGLSEEGAEVTIFNPKTLVETAIRIRVKGMHSERFRELMARRRRAEKMRERSLAAALVQDEDDETPSVLAEITLGWSGMTENGKPVDFSRKEAIRIYTAYPVIRAQVLSFVMDQRNFMPG